jgi:hypothetical protein
MEMVMRIPVKCSLALCAIMLSGLAALGSTPHEAVTRPDLNGTRVRAPGTATVYLIDNGFRRAVPNIPAYEALFRDWACIVEDLDVEDIRLGDPLGDAAGLIKSGEASGVYFIDGTTRRQVANPQVMDKYRFAWERVRDVSCEELRRLPEGPKLR